MVLVWPIIVALLDARFTTALGLVAIAGLSDGLDGYLAKRFGWGSRLGGLLDPLADKLLLVSTFVTLAWLGLIPLWLTAVVILRDLIIVSGGVIYQALIAPVQPEPSGASKLNTAAQLLFLCAVIANRALGSPPAEFVLASGAAVLVTASVSGLGYVVRWSGKAAHPGR
jgi:cardiolipin synthase